MEERLSFSDRNEFRSWLDKNHDSCKGMWIVFGRAENAVSIKAEEALEEALCFGWIDGQIRNLDSNRYEKKFTPRRDGSKWSVRNRKLAERLISSGDMTESGLAEIGKAKEDGRWETSERVPASEDQVNDLVNELTGTEPALTNFLNMSPSVRRTYTAFYLDAKKEETRKRRLKNIIARLNENKKPM